MATKKKTPRRTCATCRKWFRPHPSAQATQKTCLPTCRRKRLRTLAQGRRERGLHGHREKERRRQEACRKRRGEQAGPGLGAVVQAPMSRSTLSAQVADLEREIVEKLDHEARLSRSRLVGKLRLWLGKIDQIVDQTGSEKHPCHAPAT